jgi:hypothetical protein
VQPRVQRPRIQQQPRIQRQQIQNRPPQIQRSAPRANPALKKNN